MIRLFFHHASLHIGFLIALIGVWLPTDTQASNLPECTGNYWHNCQGIRGYVDGDKYVGEYKDDRRDGEGTSTYANGTKYVGEWKDGYRHGQGTLSVADGTEYVGEWKDGKMNGQGTFTLAGGLKFIGEWKDDKRYGQGVLYEAKGSIIQSGVWINDKFIGHANVEHVAPFVSSFKYSNYKDIIDGKIYCAAIIAPDTIYGNKKQFIEYLFITKQDNSKFTISLKLESSKILFNLLNNLTKLSSEYLKKEILVEYRFDQSNGLSENWSTSTSQKSIERPMSYDFINSLIEANTLLIRTLDFMGNQHVSKFTFDDDRSAILRTINNCASVEDLKKPGILEKLNLSLEEKFKIQSDKDKSIPKNSISNFEDNLLEAMKVAEEAAQKKAIEEAAREAIAEIEAKLRKEIEEKIAEQLIIAEMLVRFKAEQEAELKVKIAELTVKALEISEMEGTPKALHQQNCEFVYQRAYPNRLYDRGKSCR